MAEYEARFIGGPWDGETRALSGRSQIINVPVSRPSDIARWMKEPPGTRIDPPTGQYILAGHTPDGEPLRYRWREPR